MSKPVVLCILDGWGEAAPSPHNAISVALTPTWDFLCQTYPKALLQASATNVGLPIGQMGNSEVGHMHIGAGRLVMQDLMRINDAIDQGTFINLDALKALIAKMKDNKKACHILGVLSPGGVHAMQSHLIELCRILNAACIKTYVHGFLDGRDTAPASAYTFVAEFLHDIKELPYVHLGTLSGRYYAMDRDCRWDRIEKAYRSIRVDPAVPRFVEPLNYIKNAYDCGITDEFIEPAAAQNYPGIQDQDAVLCVNFRADRVRQILTALVDPSFKEFAIDPRPLLSAKVGMVPYSDALNQEMTSLFPQQVIKNTLGDVVAQAGLRQLRIAETEKYAHVTYFFNGGGETLFEQEDRLMVPSPKVATYDLKPEMSAPEVTDKLCHALETKMYDFIVVNYANGDMVGHTGRFNAAVKAVETIDQCLKRLWQIIESLGGDLIITADHGNVEQMSDPKTGEILTAHTMNPVPFLLCSATKENMHRDGSLIDIAPTVLSRLGLNIPKEMTGRVLVKP